MIELIAQLSSSSTSVALIGNLLFERPLYCLHLVHQTLRSNMINYLYIIIVVIVEVVIVIGIFWPKYMTTVDTSFKGWSLLIEYRELINLRRALFIMLYFQRPFIHKRDILCTSPGGWVNVTEPPGPQRASLLLRIKASNGSGSYEMSTITYSTLLCYISLFSWCWNIA